VRILADNTIPLLDYFFADQADVIALPFQEINPKSLKGVDILLTRSQFKVGPDLLLGSQLKFIGSCVTGTDHLDTEYLKQQSIPFYAAEGCNTQAVVDYILSVVAALMDDKILPHPPFSKEGVLKVGIIGLGRIGSRLKSVFQKLGYELYLYDPFLLDSSLDHFKDLDLITVHTPLTRRGPYPSFHLIDKNLIERQKKHCVLINTARGAVINTADLLQYGKDLILCLDVWENEPNINIELMEKSYIATPHIAGHSVQGKQRGTEYVYQAAAKLFNWPSKSMPQTRKSLGNSTVETWQELVLELMDPRKESERMKASMSNKNALPAVFSELRKTYPQRYELDFVDNIPEIVTRIWNAA
jgi:erythronate-4-phosphate dehydrogenase